MSKTDPQSELIAKIKEGWVSLASWQITCPKSEREESVKKRDKMLREDSGYLSGVIYFHGINTVETYHPRVRTEEELELLRNFHIHVNSYILGETYREFVTGLMPDDVCNEFGKLGYEDFIVQSCKNIKLDLCQVKSEG